MMPKHSNVQQVHCNRLRFFPPFNIPADRRSGKLIGGFLLHVDHIRPWDTTKGNDQSPKTKVRVFGFYH